MGHKYLDCENDNNNGVYKCKSITKFSCNCNEDEDGMIVKLLKSVVEHILLMLIGNIIWHIIKPFILMRMKIKMN